jgi:hypothetical protein
MTPQRRHPIASHLPAARRAPPGAQPQSRPRQPACADPGQSLSTRGPAALHFIPAHQGIPHCQRPARGPQDNKPAPSTGPLPNTLGCTSPPPPRTPPTSCQHAARPHAAALPTMHCSLIGMPAALHPSHAVRWQRGPLTRPHPVPILAWATPADWAVSCHRQSPRSMTTDHKAGRSPLQPAHSSLSQPPPKSSPHPERQLLVRTRASAPACSSSARGPGAAR